MCYVNCALLASALLSLFFFQGLLRLGRGNVQKTGIEDLEALSTFLGSKSWVMGGEKPSDIDCVLFGFVSVVVFTSSDASIYKTLVTKRLTNLHQHMQRMKAKYFPDWDELIKGKEKVQQKQEKPAPARPPAPTKKQ